MFIKPGWAKKLTDYMKPSDDVIIKLENLRKKYNLPHDLFANLVASSPTMTKKVQKFILEEAKQQCPGGVEKDYWLMVLASRMESYKNVLLYYASTGILSPEAESNKFDKLLSIHDESEALIEKMHSFDEFCDYIICLDEEIMDEGCSDMDPFGIRNSIEALFNETSLRTIDHTAVQKPAPKPSTKAYRRFQEYSNSTSIWRCPTCDNENPTTNNLCACGYDASLYGADDKATASRTGSGTGREPVKLNKGLLLSIVAIVVLGLLIKEVYTEVSTDNEPSRKRMRNDLGSERSTRVSTSQPENTKNTWHPEKSWSSKPIKSTSKNKDLEKQKRQRARRLQEQKKNARTKQLLNRLNSYDRAIDNLSSDLKPLLRKEKLYANKREFYTTELKSYEKKKIQKKATERSTERNGLLFQAAQQNREGD